MGRRKSVVTAKQAVLPTINTAKPATKAATKTPLTAPAMRATKTPLTAPKVPAMKSPIAAMKSTLTAPKVALGGGIAQAGGVAPTKSRMRANRSSIGMTPKAQATAIKTVQQKQADPTAKSYTDDIYAKYEAKAGKKSGKPSYR